MMRVLTEDALVVCKHELGTVQIRSTQNWFTIEGRRVLVENNLEGRPIKSCPNIGATIKPCQLTLRVQEGYSAFVRVDGKPICLDTVSGLTDGTPPGTVRYHVRKPGQSFVSEGP
jgi:hypothetical protein